MVAGRPHPETVQAVTAARIAHTSATKKPRTTTTRKKTKAYNRPQIDEILVNGKLPNLALLGLIIREALNLARGLPAGDTRLRDVLQGIIVNSAGAVVHQNQDHFNPRRQFNIYTRLFKQHCSPAKLTQPHGLSNAMSWFATGQGAGTEAFLQSLMPSGGFFKDDVDGMIGQFRAIIAANAMLPNPLSYDNSKAWGQQPNNQLLVQPTKEKMDVEEKFDPPWAPKVLEIWTGHLGDVAGKDPATFSEEQLPSWSSTMRLVVGLGLPAFKQGLTLMQMINTLAYSGVIRKATAPEMAVWISENKKLGAVSGLELLGFRVNTADRIQAAYMCCHYFLDKYLTQDDKDILGFDAAFTEHDLCKAPRWDRYVNGALVKIAAQLPQSEWTSGANRTDSQAMPFPAVTRQELESALKTTEVRPWRCMAYHID
ncbi:hypothetical protein C8R46DRAFT_888615 [Mycena filopes]|nr:hypothetical protein C8R46DRAFT_922916 [Mycena filopes]KAJ7177632.1 hypothetical protein C8R46DRAFT_888615 [Mycena filopes]